MVDKIRIAIIYTKEFKFFLPNYRDNTQYNFFHNTLTRNNRAHVEFFLTENKFDINILKNKFDVILLADNRLPHIPSELSGINEVRIPVISRTGDPHSMKQYGRLKIHDSHKIKYYFGPNTPEYFYKFYPNNMKYKFILAGLEPEFYKSVKPFDERISDKILNTGNVGNMKLTSRMANAILNPKRSSWYFYKLRTLCNKLSYVDYSGMSGKSYIHKDYPSYVSSYKSAIAAATFYAVIKYLELTAAGCLTFMEVSKINRDAEILGFRDNESAIFIDENNYKKKFKEFLSNPNDSHWKTIAENGKKHTINNLNNDKAAESLIELIEEVIQ